MLEQFEKIGKEAISDLKNVSDLDSLEQFRIKYLGRKGLVIQMLSQIGRLPPEIKPQAGQLANKVKNEISKAFDQLKNSLSSSEEKKHKARGKIGKIGESHDHFLAYAQSVI